MRLEHAASLSTNQIASRPRNCSPCLRRGRGTVAVSQAKIPAVLVRRDLRNRLRELKESVFERLPRLCRGILLQSEQRDMANHSVKSSQRFKVPTAFWGALSLSCNVPTASHIESAQPRPIFRCLNFWDFAPPAAAIRFSRCAV